MNGSSQGNFGVFGSCDFLIFHIPPASFLLITLTISVLQMWDAAGNCSSTDLSNCSIQGRGRKSLQILLKPKCSLQMGAFLVFILIQLGQQSALARTLETLKIDVCCLLRAFAGSRFHNQFYGSDTTFFSRFTFRMSMWSGFEHYWQAGIGIALNMPAEHSSQPLFIYTV